MMRQYSDGEREHHKLRGVVTGKDVRIGGIRGAPQATGQGLAYCIEEWAKEHGRARKGATLMFRASATSGSSAAEILLHMGARPSRSTTPTAPSPARTAST